MKIQFSTDEIASIINNYFNYNVNLKFENNIIVQTKINFLNVNAIILPQANKDLVLTLDKVTVGGINFTGFARSKVFDFIKKYKNYLFKIVPNGRSIIISSDLISFENISVDNCVELCVSFKV